jgi:hypothetical protein
MLYPLDTLETILHAVLMKHTVLGIEMAKFVMGALTVKLALEDKLATGLNEVAVRVLSPVLVYWYRKLPMVGRVTRALM